MSARSVISANKGLDPANARSDLARQSIEILQGEDTVFRIDQVSHFRFRDYASAWIEYKPTDQWTLRAQAWMLGSYDQTRTVFTGPRDTDPQAYTEIRSMEPESRLQVRVRRTF